MAVSKYKAKILAERMLAAEQVWLEVYELWRAMQALTPRHLGPGTTEWALLRAAEKVFAKLDDEYREKVKGHEPPVRDYSDACWEKWRK